MMNYTLYCYHHGLPHSDIADEYAAHLAEMQDALNAHDFCGFMDSYEALCRLGFSLDERFVGYDSEDASYVPP